MIDHYKEILNVSNVDTDNVNNVLTLSGGGTGAAFYVMGAVKYLVDKGLYKKYDTISGVSGSTILMSLLQPCNNWGYDNEEGWYDTYVRNVLYGIAKQRILSKFLAYRLNPFNIGKSNIDLISEVLNPVFESSLKAFDRPMDTFKGDKNFEFNCIHAPTWHMMSTHNDIYDPAIGISPKNWWLMRLMRCCLPFTYINDIMCMDAGFIDNNSISGIVTKYKFKEILFVTLSADYVNPNYDLKVKSFYEMLQFIFSKIQKWITTPPNSLNSHLSMLLLNAYKNNGTIVNAVYPERKDYTYLDGENFNYFVGTEKYYNGLLFFDEEVARICENIGYADMHRVLSGDNFVELKKEEYPNPEYSDEESVKKYFGIWLGKSIPTYMWEEFSTEYKNRFKSYYDQLVGKFITKKPGK